jgi:hypothetical protein
MIWPGGGVRRDVKSSSVDGTAGGVNGQLGVNLTDTESADVLDKWR